MNHLIFTIYDEKAHAYLPPFVMHNDAMAIRVFGDCLNSNDHQFAKHPHDYSLYRVGEFDDSSGTVNPTNSQMLGNGVEFLDQSPLQDYAPNEKPIGNDPPILGGPESGNSA